MSRIISVHSFRGGTGKSNITANVATQVAMKGNRVGVIDTDIASPGIHVLFSLDEEEIDHALNDYLWGKCEIEETAYEVSRGLTAGNGSVVVMSGNVYLIPASIKAGEIARVLREGYDVGLLNDGFRALIERLDLDYLFIDTHPGLNEETLLSIAISDVLFIIMRPDHQDYQGTGVTVDLARKLEVPEMYLIVNKALPGMAIKDVVEETYKVPVAAVLPLSEDVARLGSEGIFSLRYPEHPWSKGIAEIVSKIESI